LTNCSDFEEKLDVEGVEICTVSICNLSAHFCRHKESYFW
jgi:hypothetical protein